MRTNIEIDDQLMTRAKAVSGLATKKQVVQAALEALIAQENRRKVAGSYGTIDWQGDLDDWRDDESRRG